MQVRSNLVDNSSSKAMKLDYGTNSYPVCPKPRRPVSSIPEVLINPLIRSCSKHMYSSVPNSNGSRISGILNIIDDKQPPSETRHDQYSTCSGCSPPCYPGSPPGRTDNPLVHDVQFLQHQMELLSPLSRTNLSDKFGYA
ncbi:hypothetical protein Dimus_017412 [Dionaea muscipula]